MPELATDGRGPALGVIDDAVYAEARFPSAPPTGCCSTATDWSSDGGRTWSRGWSRCVRPAAAAARTDPHELLDDVLAALNPPDDDVTLLEVGRT